MKRLLPLLLALCCVLDTSAISLHFTSYAETCFGGDGGIQLEVTGGVPPYTFLWSNASTMQDQTNLTSGSYSVTVTDNLGATVDGQCEVMILGLEQLFPNNIGVEGLGSCGVACNGGFRVHLQRIIGGYTFSTTPNMTVLELPEDEPLGFDLYTTYEFLGVCAGQTVDLEVFPQNGCGSGQASIPIGAKTEPEITVLEITGSCAAENDGTLTVELSATAFFESWSILAEDGSGGSVSPVGSDWFSGGTQSFQLLDMHPGNWTLNLSSITSVGSGQPSCITSLPFVVPDLGADCGTLSGTVHFETDVDCVQDGLEVGIPLQLVRITPGPLYGITGADGAYRVDVPYGSYAVEQINPDAVQLCPVAAPVPFTVSVVQQTAVVDLADSLLTPFNMSVGLWNTIARPGFTFNYAIDLFNTNGHPGENITITLNYDPLFTFVSASPAATVSVPGQVQWTLPVLTPFAHQHFTISLQVPADPLLIGTVHDASVQVSSSTGEINLADNTVARVVTVQGSYDPNDKTAYTSTGTDADLYFLDIDDHIDYLVRFQNTGTDTAFTVVITDTIGPLLDMGSLRIMGSSHNFTPSIASGNVLRFTFADILLPDSNTNEAASHGYVAFRLRPVPGLGMGEQINNAADIFFDFNPPVRTNTAVLTTDYTVGLPEEHAPVLSLSPVPVSDRLFLRTDGSVFTSITILSSDGRTVAQHAGGTSVDVATLAPGVYVLQARTNEGREVLARFVKR